MFELTKGEAQTVSGGFYSTSDNLYVFVSNYGISDSCYPMVDYTFGEVYDQQLTMDAFILINSSFGCGNDMSQYVENLSNELYFSIPA